MFYKYGMGFLINPYIYGGGVSYLVDDYSPLVAFSVRKISSTATNCLRVRRTSDSTEQDIGFSGNDLDTASLESFCSATDGVVVKWYNQGTGGATYDASQSTASLQPLIVSSGTTITTGSKPAIQVDSTLNMNLPVSNPGNLNTQIFVHQTNTQKTVNYVSSGRIGWNGSLGGINGLYVYDGSTIGSLTGEDLNRHLGFFYYNSNWYIAKDGASATSFGSVTGQFGVTNMCNTGGQSNPSYTQEAIFFSADESANKAALESDINGYYSIY